MTDYIKRFVIACIMALCISLLFLGGKLSNAEMVNLQEITSHWIWPTEGVITDTYGTRNGHHHGVDIAGSYGDVVRAVDAGIVTKSYYSSSYGHVVFVKHANNLETVYAHMKKRMVEEGQTINQGDALGEMGSTGHSSGVHLHFEVHQYEWKINKENAFDPMRVLGHVHIGESIEVIKEEKNVNDSLQVFAKLPEYEKSKYFLKSDLEDIRSFYEGEVMEHSEHQESEGINELIHIVDEGDNLWNIAQKYDTSVENIMEVNNITSDLILPDQELLIQVGTIESYVVQSGDTLTSISARTNRTITDIMKDNGLISDLIHPEQVILIKQKE